MSITGTSVLSGMLEVTFFGLFLTPVFYVVIAGSSSAGARRQNPCRAGAGE